MMEYGTPRQSHSIPDHGGYDPPGGSMSYDGISHKLDRLLELFEEQRRETMEIRNYMAKLRADVDRCQTASSCASSSSAATPVVTKLPLELSAAVRHLQEKGAEDVKFVGDQAYQSERNQRAKNYLLTHLSDRFSEKYSPWKIKRAVHRFYESRRRIFNDSKLGRRETVNKTKRSAKKKEARKRAYNARKKFLRSDKEESLWKEIDWQFMTDESSGQEDAFIKHSLPWRSKVLNKFIAKLDKRASQHSVTTKCDFKRKERVERSSSSLCSPTNAPIWAINKKLVASHPTPVTPKTSSYIPRRQVLRDTGTVTTSSSESDDFPSEEDNFSSGVEEEADN